MSNITPDVPPELAYLVLRTAHARFEKATADLAEAELNSVLGLAHKQFEIETQILNAPEAQGVIVTEQDFLASLKEIQARYETEGSFDEDSFRADLVRNGMDEDQLRQAVWRELQVEAILERVGARAADINDVDVKIYYYMHLDRFEQPETRTVRHILLTINPDFPENTRDAAHQRMEQIRKRLLKKPHRFEEQAMKHSECPTALEGGKLGCLPRGQLFPSLDDALFKMKTGELSEVLESELGFHIL
jgi:nitrogen fixation protein NifM